MASGGYGGPYSYYNQPAAAPYYYVQRPARGGGGGGSRPPLHLFLLLATLLLLAATSLYARCEAAVESMAQQLRPLLILSPLLLIVAAQLWVATSGDHRQGGGALAYLLEQVAPADQYYRSGAPYGRWDGGSSPWGVAVVLVLVLILVSYQSSFQEWRLFPLRGR
ncbi:hypothetical protein CFC21_101677 [Triticum aestivum]|uniref:Uncharacterized protein n=3 Tax=Triticum TaxID=4564 RepID=A0A9R0ZU34_TRITD|nr:uncharacterized protein LOC119340725 [Triticum dicoccoides]XP_044434826.1 uncharacterized protein LOC123161034 [Triticum aestivum]KAF7100133.1 hypothetical protein CFC21_101677 [Triticum aestivum]VAI84064.1 unnamed protein product [Triticum turgidum subsp. durum]